MELDRLITQLSAGFEALQDEYQKLHGQHQTLQRKLATARQQYNELAKLYGNGQTATPPLSLSSSPAVPREDTIARIGVAEILDGSTDRESKDAANKVRKAVAAVRNLGDALPVLANSEAQGVKIWSGPSADRPREGSSCMMPSISESPLEQDFTVEGIPSKLGCPFASMSKKKLSSHAASVLSRYNQSNSVGAQGSIGAASTPLSAASRINGKESLSQRNSRRASMADPIKAEICGLSDHASVPMQSPEMSKDTKETVDKQDNADVGVCPIRFLDQHSPEEVATYFENHKHELPRSHEVCVRRYQTNEDQIKQLDAKYGNLVSMIQGLGEKHKTMLPQDPEDGVDEGISDAQVRKWASSVSAQAPEPGAEDEADERQPHFERPLRDIRVGESPSRPWGISVPAKYLDEVKSETSSKPAQIAGPAAPDVLAREDEPSRPTQRPAGKCPFGHGAAAVIAPKPAPAGPTMPGIETKPAPTPTMDAKPTILPGPDETKHNASQMVFTGPVFIGYSPEDAARILNGWQAGT